MMTAVLIYPLAAVAEIAGCFAFWGWMRSARSPLWLVPGLVSVTLFAWLLTQAPVALAGRAYAAYGGIYVAASLLWLWVVEGAAPTRWDILGATICVGGAVVILAGPRWQAS